MNFTSTRQNKEITSAMAIAQGISNEGGLYVPKSFPKLENLENLVNATYNERAYEVLKLYLTDFSDDELKACISGAYDNKFDDNIPAPVVEVADNTHLLELWHGPTCAFKDMALQLLPHLLTKSAQKVSDGKTIVILVATSGDTGKAALDGFADVDNTKIIVFYPVDGVSPMQKLQMTTQQGNNVAVCAIEGNFDDAQTGVKQIFARGDIKAMLEANNMEFSSANSINFGRLVPQIVYYVSAYCDLIKEGKINMGQPFNVVVPTGNFGNILAAYYAKQMGLPIAKLICASNKNNILSDFINTGVYDKNRAFYTTTSPSMDILISSNLERLLYHISGEDSEKIKDLMTQLNTKGVYKVDDEMLTKIRNDFYAGFCDDNDTAETIKETFQKYGYLCDTHTAVAMKVYSDYKENTGDNTPTVVVSTASPYKFASSVLKAVDESKAVGNDFEMVDTLSQITNTKIPAPLASLQSREVIHKTVTKKEDMSGFISDFLKV